MSFQVNEIKAKITAEETILANLKRARDSFLENIGYQMARIEQEIYELHIQMQLAEVNQAFAAEYNEEAMCYHCGREVNSCVCAAAPTEQDVEDAFETGAQVNAEQVNAGQMNAEENLHDVWGGEEPEPSAARNAEGTKLKWVSRSNPETYRVAIVKKDGILEVKRVTDGAGYCHDTKVCRCRPCSEIIVSGGRLPPWLKGVPLTKTFYATESDWRISLPFGGNITVTEPQLSNRALKKLCCTPLTGTTDGLKLKELE